MRPRSAKRLLKAVVVMFALALPSTAVAAPEDTVISLTPDANEHLTGGVPATYTFMDSEIWALYDPSTSVLMAVNAGEWQFEFGPPISVGSYSVPFARIYMRTRDRFCGDGFVGNYTVNTLTPGPFANITNSSFYFVAEFDADFTVYCNGGSSALRGHIHYEDPPDTTPPTMPQFNDITVEAATETGTDRPVYQPGSAEDRGFYIPMECTPYWEESLPIGTTTVHCTATDAYGNQGVMEFDITVLPPLRMTLQVKDEGDVTARGTAVIKGTVSCRWAVTIDVGAHLEQILGKKTTSGDGTTSVACSPPDTKWQVRIEPVEGRFKPGTAAAHVSAFTCPYFCHFEEAQLSIDLE
jgi:hypothetical protein